MNIIDFTIGPSLLRGDGIFRFDSEPNQLYRTCGNSASESFQIGFSGAGLWGNKFFHLLLKEWFQAVSEGGFMVIEYVLPTDSSPMDAEDELWKQFNGKYEIIRHSKIEGDAKIRSTEDLFDILRLAECEYDSVDDVGFSDFRIAAPGEEWRLIVRKTGRCFPRGDTIDKWSFGIITNGDRNDWVIDLVSSIKNSGVPIFEIIICGKFEDSRLTSGFTYLPFNKRSKHGWLDKKKNLIIERASHNNVAILHDRYVLSDDWYSGMRRWGNNFEILTCQQLEPDLKTRFCERAIAWSAYGKLPPTVFRSNFHHFLMEIDDRDLYPSTHLSGGVLIIKKSFGIKLHECLFWNNYEDLEYSYSSESKGAYPRLNPYSTLVVRNYGRLSGVFSRGNRSGQIILRYNSKDNRFHPSDGFLRFLLRKMLFTIRVVSEESFLSSFVFRLFRFVYHYSGISKFLRF